MSLAYQFTTAVAALLMSQTDAGEQVYLNLTHALEREEMPAIVIELISDDAESFGDETLSCVLKLKVVIVTRNDDWQSELDALRGQVHKLMTNDLTLNQMLFGLQRTRMTMQAASADEPFAAMTQEYSGHYISLNQNL